MVAWTRVYSRDNPTSTNKVRVCFDASWIAGLEIDDVAIAADGLMRVLKQRDPILAVAVARVALQLTWRIATDRYTHDGRNVCFVVELDYDEYDALTKHANGLFSVIDARIQYYRDLLSSGHVRNEAAVRRKIDAMILIREILASLVEYHAKRKKHANSK